MRTRNGANRADVDFLIKVLTVRNWDGVTLQDYKRSEIARGIELAMNKVGHEPGSGEVDGLAFEVETELLSRLRLWRPHPKTSDIRNLVVETLGRHPELREVMEEYIIYSRRRNRERFLPEATEFKNIRDTLSHTLLFMPIKMLGVGGKLQKFEMAIQRLRMEVEFANRKLNTMAKLYEEDIDRMRKDNNVPEVRRLTHKMYNEKRGLITEIRRYARAIGEEKEEAVEKYNEIVQKVNEELHRIEERNEGQRVVDAIDVNIAVETGATVTTSPPRRSVSASPPQERPESLNLSSNQTSTPIGRFCQDVLTSITDNPLVRFFSLRRDSGT